MNASSAHVTSLALGLHLVTWNLLAPLWVHCRDYQDFPATCEELEFRNRKHTVLRHIRQLQADVFCLQEIDQTWWSFLSHHLQHEYDARFLPHDARHWAEYHSGATHLKPNGNAILLRKASNFHHVSTPYAYDLSANGNRALGISATWRGQRYHFFSVHMDDQSARWRQIQLRALAQAVRNLPAHVTPVLAGDFNDEGAAMRWQRLMPEYTWMGAHHFVTYPSRKRSHVIDFIFIPKTIQTEPVGTMQLRVPEFIISTSGPTPLVTWGSDHFPVSVWLRPEAETKLTPPIPK
jgi:endonuclease/exonuclease/phosphatase family metal-dependent hydrolase